MGSKGDVDISGVGGGEPRNDYTSFSTVLPADFPDFDDGAGEIELIPGGLPTDVGLYYFQSSYDFFQFPGEDGFFGFSNDTTYNVGGRRGSASELNSVGDWWVDFTTNRIYSYANNLFESYVHMAERDLEVTGEGVFSLWPDLVTVTHKHDPINIPDPGWDGLTPSWIDDNRYRLRVLAVSLSNQNHMLAEWRRWSVTPSVSLHQLLYSHDGGASWHLVPEDYFTIPQSGGINYSHRGLPLASGPEMSKSQHLYGSALFIRDPNNSNKILFNHGDFETWRPSGYPSQEKYWSAQGGIHTREHYLAANHQNKPWIVAAYTDTTDGTSGPLKNRYVGPIESDPVGVLPGNPYWPYTKPDITFSNQGGPLDFDEFEGYGHTVEWLRHGEISALPGADHYIMANKSGNVNGAYDVWEDTTWKGRAFYWHSEGGPGAVRGVGWDASLEPDPWNFETIVWLHMHHIKIEVGGVGTTFPVPILIARYCTYGLTPFPWAWEYPGHSSIGCEPPLWHFEYRIYASEDIGKTYDHVHTIDTTQDGEVMTMQFDPWYHSQDETNSGILTYGSRNAPRFLIPIRAYDFFPGPPCGLSGVAPGWAGNICTYAYFTGLDWEGGILGSQDKYHPVDHEDEMPEPRSLFQYGAAYEDAPSSLTLRIPNLLTSNEGIITWTPGTSQVSFWGTPLHAGKKVIHVSQDYDHRNNYNLNPNWPPAENEEIWMVEFSEPQYDNYVYDRMVCDSAGFTVRAPHINELKTKLQQLNANVRTSGTNAVDFGIEFLMPDGNLLPRVTPNNPAQPVRDDHFFTLRREVDKVIGQIAEEPGSEFYCTDCDLFEYSALMNSQPLAEDEQISISTLLGMRKTLQALYANGFYCTCYSHCPCQTFVDIHISGGKK